MLTMWAFNLFISSGQNFGIELNLQKENKGNNFREFQTWSRQLTEANCK